MGNEIRCSGINWLKVYFYIGGGEVLLAVVAATWFVLFVMLMRCSSNEGCGGGCQSDGNDVW